MTSSYSQMKIISMRRIKGSIFSIITFSESYSFFCLNFKEYDAIKDKMSMITSWSSNFARNLHKNIPHTTMIFEFLYLGILADNRHTNIQNTTRLNVIKNIIYQPPKLPSLITKKKWWKFFCGDQLERIFISSCFDSLPSGTGFWSRLWITLCSTLQRPEAEKDGRTKITFSILKNPLKWWARQVFSFLFFDLQLFFVSAAQTALINLG